MTFISAHPWAVIGQELAPQSPSAARDDDYRLAVGEEFAREQIGDADLPLQAGCDAPKKMIASTNTPQGQFKIIAQVFERRYCAPALVGEFWDLRSPRPPRIIAQMSASIGSNKQRIPIGAYLDLGEPREISAVSIGEKVIVKILGVGEGTWEAELQFRNGVLIYRKVYDRVFSDDLFQETTYHYIPDDGR